MIRSWFGMFGIYTPIFGQTHCVVFFPHLPGSLDFNKGATPSPLLPPLPLRLLLLLLLACCTCCTRCHIASSGFCGVCLDPNTIPSAPGARLGPKACQRKCQTECQNRCQTECRKRMSERLPDRMSEQMADRMPGENVRI